MTQESITLNGNKYSGRFSANTDTTKGLVKKGYRKDLVDLRQWQGIGEIKDNQTLEFQKFVFNTSRKEYIRKLEYEIIRVEEKSGREINPQIIKEEALCDIVLKQMYGDAIKEKDEILPSVSPKALDYEEILDKGLIADNKRFMNGSYYLL